MWEEFAAIQTNKLPRQTSQAKPPDVSPMDYCDFDLLKRALSKLKSTTIDGLWKVVKEKGQGISLKILCIALSPWKA